MEVVFKIVKHIKPKLTEREKRKAIKRWLKKPLSRSQLKNLISILAEENFHHRVPQCLKGKNELGFVEVVNKKQHVLWHSVFDAHNAQITAGTAQDLFVFAGWDEKIELIHKKTGKVIPLVRGRVNMTFRRFEKFREFCTYADVDTPQSLVEMINETWNDPRCHWVVI